MNDTTNEKFHAVELSDDVKVTIDAKELTDDQLDQVAGGVFYFHDNYPSMKNEILK